MFTGIIEELGVVKSVKKGHGAEICISAGREFVESLERGVSVSINGACQSVTKLDENSFTFFSTYATLETSNLKDLNVGNKVNLERALLANGRFDGHIVSGHVDAMAKILNVIEKENVKEIHIERKDDWGKYLVKKGSVCVDGISLTVFDVTEHSFSLVIIPITLKDTTLKNAKAGQNVNIETDILAKYVENLLNSKKSGSSLENLLNTL